MTTRIRTAPILQTRPERNSPQELLAGRQMVKEWTVDELVPIVERGLKGGRNFEHGRKLFGAVGCASRHRFDNDGASVGPDLTSVAGRFSVRDLNSLKEDEIQDLAAFLLSRGDRNSKAFR